MKFLQVIAMLTGIASAAVGVIGYFSSSRHAAHRSNTTPASSTPASGRHNAQPAGATDRANHSRASDKSPNAGGGSAPEQKK